MSDPKTSSIDRGRLTALLADLVRIDSVNPAFRPDAGGEREICTWIAERLAPLGMQVSVHEAAPGRPSLVGLLPGTGGGRSLMLYAHVDTVGFGAMERPLDPVIRDGRLYGRGAYDMKCGLAACMEALHVLSSSPPAGDVLLAAVADEEVASIGMEEVLRHVRADAAVVTEPTELELCIAHKGFCWIEVEVIGRAAHGSRHEEGVDANLRMGRVLHALAALEEELRARTPHALVGPPSLHVGTLHGGDGNSIYASRCVATIERRMLPRETADVALAEVTRLLDALRREDPALTANARIALARGGMETDAHSGIASAVRSAAADVLGTAPPITGAAYWMDAALIAQAGIETVAFGAVGAGAHGDVEWVDLGSCASLAEILVRSARDFCG